MPALKPKLVPLGKSKIEVPTSTAKEASKIAKRDGRCFVIRRGDDWKVKNCMADIPPNWEIVGKMVRDGVVFVGSTLAISECDR
ncbi:MAG: hypothetical protein AAGA60_30085 [Cyanobacteria bacterium P01_E01_bin.42]